MFKIWKIIIFWWILTSKHAFAKVWKIINFDINLEKKNIFFQTFEKSSIFGKFFEKSSFFAKIWKNILVLNGVVWCLDTICMVSYHTWFKASRLVQRSDNFQSTRWDILSQTPHFSPQWGFLPKNFWQHWRISPLGFQISQFSFLTFKIVSFSAASRAWYFEKILNFISIFI